MLSRMSRDIRLLVCAERLFAFLRTAKTVLGIAVAVFAAAEIFCALSACRR